VYDVNCTRCGASHLVTDGQDWAENHAHPHSVEIERVA
jgi:hypothetical protein